VHALADRVSATLPYLPERVADEARKLVPPLDELALVMEQRADRTVELGEARDAILPIMQGCPGADLSNYDDGPGGIAD
jgi:hypothetical protein